MTKLTLKGYLNATAIAAIFATLLFTAGFMTSKNVDAKTVEVTPLATPTQSNEEVHQASPSTDNGYVLQMGRFAQVDNALSLQEQLKNKNIGAKLFVDHHDEAPYVLVYGYFHNKESAKDARDTLKQRSHVDSFPTRLALL